MALRQRPDRTSLMIYATHPPLRYRQMLGDGLAFAWCALWIWLGMAANQLIDKLAVPGAYLRDSGDKVHASGPGVLGTVLTPLNAAGDALTKAGTAQVSAIDEVSFAIGLFVALIPTLPMLSIYVFLRIRWIHRAMVIHALAERPGAERLLAYRALTHQSLEQLLRISEDPLRDLEDGNVDPYAALELQTLGIHRGQNVRI